MIGVRGVNREFRRETGLKLIQHGHFINPRMAVHDQDRFFRAVFGDGTLQFRGDLVPAEGALVQSVRDWNKRKLVEIVSHLFRCYAKNRTLKETKSAVFMFCLNKPKGDTEPITAGSVVIRRIARFNSVVIMLLAVFFFIYPGVRALLDIRDPALQRPGTPKAAWRLYRNLTPRYAHWAKERVAQGRAKTLSTSDISGTEWPLFGSVFYLWSIENLQNAWDAGDHSAGLEPKVYASDAIIAASELVIDPKHAAWVKKHWGENYLHRENVFYRMLVIGALTSREKLLHDGAHLDLLRDQVESLAKELDFSKTGLLDDYPGQCYPGDVMAALMCIKRADAVLGTDHSRLIGRAVRGFIGKQETRYHLPPYSANADTGVPSSDARGCANSYMALTAPELWPGQARLWFALYDESFWQKGFTSAGYREYPRNDPNSNWSIDVDAGPVIAGYGVAASAFGIGAARKNGRFDRAYPLATEMLVTVGELPNGTLAIPRLLSNLSDAPFLGEAAILWQLSVEPEKGFDVKTGGAVPAYVYIVPGIFFLIGILLILGAAERFRASRRPSEDVIPVPTVQAAVWAGFMAAAVAVIFFHHALIGVVILAVGVMLPVKKRKKIPKGTEDWPDEKPPPEPKSTG